jgi:hypothetical protein
MNDLLNFDVSEACTGHSNITTNDLSRPDRLKPKLRSGFSIRSHIRPTLFKVLLLKKDLDLDHLDIVFDNDDNLHGTINNSPVFDKDILSNKWLNSKGIRVRNRVLHQILIENPQVTYAPLLPLFTSVLVLYFEPSQAFYLLSKWIKSEWCCIARNKTDAVADDNTLRDLALLRLKSNSLKRILTKVTTNLEWRKWLENSSLQIIIHFFDCLLLEGPKIKFRFGLAYLNLSIKAGEDTFDLSRINSMSISEDRILIKAFAIKRFPWATCSKLITRHRLLLDIRNDQNETAKNNLNEYLPQAKYANSKIISTDKVAHVISILPPRFSVQNIEMIYSTYKDGYSLTSVNQKIRGYSDLLFFIECHSNVLKQIFPIKIGCFMASIDSSKTQNTGNGESFVFRIKDSAVNSWFWNERQESIFAIFNKSSLSFGNGVLELDSDLKNCSTAPSSTFGCPNLLTKEDSFVPFEVKTLEIFTFIQDELND